jgi:hypothetical protein
MSIAVVHLDLTTRCKPRRTEIRTVLDLFNTNIVKLQNIDALPELLAAEAASEPR